MANVMTPKFRVSFPFVFKPRPNKFKNNEPQYSMTLLFPKGADLTVLKNAAREAITEKWGADQKKWPPNLRLPFRKHEEKAVTDEATQQLIFPQGMEAGGIFLNVASKQKPGLVDHDRQDIIDESQFYAGCYARATLSVYTYDQAGNRGVNFGLQNVQKLAEGEPLSGRARAEDEFAPVKLEGGSQAGSGNDDLFG
jgi:hypothetical protein